TGTSASTDILPSQTFVVFSSDQYLTVNPHPPSHAEIMAAATLTKGFDPKYDTHTYPTVSLNTHSGHPGHTDEVQDAQVHQLRGLLEAEGYTERLDTITLVGF